ncbi:UNVERIFIED_CONTAM: CHAP domain-containing protein, partial [Pseudomonas aeruginosa]
ADAISRVQAVSTIVSANNDLMQQQKEDKQAVVDKKAENEKKVKQLEATEAELETKRQDLLSKQFELNV